MSESSDGSQADEAKPAGHWLVGAITMLGLGSLGPANVYLMLTDSHYMDRFDGWRALLLPFGVWLLTGFLFQGLTIAWSGGVRGDADWNKRGERAWAWWCKLGLWLLGIGLAIVVAAYVFSGLADYLSSLDRGTLLIAGLLFMILIALWRIADQMRQR